MSFTRADDLLGAWRLQSAVEVFDDAADGFLDAQLLVYADNSRAVSLYQQLGWRPQKTPAPHLRTGKPEQCYHLKLAG